MSFLDRFLNAVRLNDDYDDDDEFLDDDEEEDIPEEESQDEEPEEERFDDEAGKKEEKPKNRFFRKMSDEEEQPRRTARNETTQRTSSRSQKVTPIRSQQRTQQQEAGGNDMEVSVIKPTTMENTREIADTLMANSTVVLNLEGIDIDLAQRIIDFACGTCYAIHGSLQKVSSYIFILTPSTVEISGDIQDILNGGIPAIRSDF